MKKGMEKKVETNQQKVDYKNPEQLKKMIDGRKTQEQQLIAGLHQVRGQIVLLEDILKNLS